ncbi:unnamed protein product [Cuscuta campestris]|uniref:Uncharacterized protein n=1 Tax=Cuscuta campestris TaxID=132261 RepID=A0A484MI82_9ASTE|nr:unnamed protein product [Cuscuta campestris]
MISKEPTQPKAQIYGCGPGTIIYILNTPLTCRRSFFSRLARETLIFLKLGGAEFRTRDLLVNEALIPYQKNQLNQKLKLMVVAQK